MNRSFCRLAIFCALAFSPLLADAKLANPADASASFRAIGPRGFRIEGRSNQVGVADDGNWVTISVQLTQLTTGIALRDKHMREKYLETEKYPTAELLVPRWALRFPEEGKRMSAWAMGTLKMHGKTKEVKVFYKAGRVGGTVDVDGSTEVNLNDFGIEVPSHLGLSLKPDVAIEVHFQAQDA
ncbi:MAG TPA: YceI family protein [Polyangiaceae bacterium]|nr:YceI family protein [Polyangiaceae bacterium]